MYGVEGNGWIVMGDPIGQPELIEELLWQFRELCDQHDASPVFYQVSARYLPLYLELGLIPFKLGEEAIVDLAAFELAGSRLRNLRQSHAKGKREGCRSRWWRLNVCLHCCHASKRCRTPGCRASRARRRASRWAVSSPPTSA